MRVDDSGSPSKAAPEEEDSCAASSVKNSNALDLKDRANLFHMSEICADLMLDPSINGQFQRFRKEIDRPPTKKKPESSRKLPLLLYSSDCDLLFLILRSGEKEKVGWRE